MFLIHPKIFAAVEVSYDIFIKCCAIVSKHQPPSINNSFVDISPQTMILIAEGGEREGETVKEKEYVQITVASSLKMMIIIIKLKDANVRSSCTVP